MEKNLSYVLISDGSKRYTNLSSYDRRTKRFEGEYSLRFNQYSEEPFFLHRFLLDHRGEALKVIDNTYPKYRKVLDTYEHFMGQEVDKYIEEQLLIKIDREEEIGKIKKAGQFQIEILKRMVKEQLENVQNKYGSNRKEQQVLTGKESSLQWVLSVIEEIIQKS